MKITNRNGAIVFTDTVDGEIIDLTGLVQSLGFTIGTTAGTVAAGNDYRLNGVLSRFSNLSEIASPSAARTNLGLATVASSGSASDLTLGTLSSARLPDIGTAGTYGSGTKIPVITTDAKGRITSVSQVSVVGGSGTGSGTVTPTGSFAVNDVLGAAAGDGNSIKSLGTPATFVRGQISAGTGLSFNSSTGKFSLVTPTTSTLGGVFAADAPVNSFVRGIGTNGMPIFARPAITDVQNLQETLATKANASAVAPISRQRFSVLDGNATAGQKVFIVNAYDPGSTQVYLNGSLLSVSRGYVAFDGSSVTLLNGLGTNDTLEVMSQKAGGSVAGPSVDIAGWSTRSRQRFSVADGNATAGQTVFNVATYTLGTVEVFKNGVLLPEVSAYTATTGTSVTLVVAINSTDKIDIISQTARGISNAAPISHQHNISDIIGYSSYSRQRFSIDDGNAVAGQTTFNVASYTIGTVQAYLNGGLLPRTLGVTATDGNTVVLTDPITAQDILEIVSQGALNVADAARIVHTHVAADITGLGNSATLNVGTAAGTVAAGNDPRIVGSLKASNNLSEVTDTGLARANIGAVGYVSPSFTGAPTAPTADPTANTTQIATTAFVARAVSSVSSFNPSALAPLDSPVLTGTPRAPNPAVGTNTTQIATTSFVANATSSFATLASPAFSGTPTAPTANAGTTTSQIATTSFVSSAVSSAITSAIAVLTDGAPNSLNTFSEVAAALYNDPNFANTVSTALTLKAPLAAPSFTGNATAVTATAGTNTTQIATTAFVIAEIVARALSKATANDLRGFVENTKYLTAKTIGDASTFSSDPWTATYAPDMITGFNRTVILAGNTTLGQFTNLVDGQSIILMLVQDATGSRTISINTTYHKVSGGTAPTASTAANAVDRWSGIARNRGGVMVVEWGGYEKDIK